MRGADLLRAAPSLLFHAGEADGCFQREGGLSVVSLLRWRDRGQQVRARSFVTKFTAFNTFWEAVDLQRDNMSIIFYSPAWEAPTENQSIDLLLSTGSMNRSSPIHPFPEMIPRRLRRPSPPLLSSAPSTVEISPTEAQAPSGPRRRFVARSCHVVK